MKNTFLTFKLIILFVYLLFINGCSSDTEDDLAANCENSSLIVEQNAATKASCAEGGSISVVGSGGEGNLEYSIDGTNFGTATSFNDLSADSYTVTVRDENGCTATTDVIIETDDNTVSFEVAVTGSACDVNTGSIVITASGGSGNYEYSIDGNNFLTDNSFTSIPSGEYRVEVKDGDCVVNRDITVGSEVTLSGDIMPIINANCAVSGCHGDAVGPRLTSNSAIVAAADRIRARTTARTMPPSGRAALTDEEINKITCWVEGGSQNN
ncbi:MAG: c-type cytochrome [Cyclobacteriaceae bacterium]